MRVCLVLLVVAACGGGKGGDSGVAVPATGTATGGGGGVDPDAPVLTGCEAVCVYHNVGDAFWQWDFECDVDDPQGADTVERLGDVRVLRGADEVGTSSIVCADAICYGSDRADRIGADCDSPSAYTFEFLAYDADGHVGTGTTTGAGG